MDLLVNAIESIQVGVEDYQAATRPRLLSAVRNIHAGILLLYKEALRRHSPAGSDEVLIKSKILPSRLDNGELRFVGDGTKTVDVQQIKERFKGLNIATDWNRFDAITRVRNDIEHYYTTTSQEALHGVMANAFLIVRAFVATELGSDPLGLLGDSTWQAMLDVTDIYKAEREECRKALDAIEWHSGTLARGIQELSCQQCGSDLLAPTRSVKEYDEVILRCRACGAEEQPDIFVPRAVAENMAFEMYLVGDDGAALPYVSCPECGEDSYVVEEQRCALCGHKAEHECVVCGNPIPPEELDCSPYCGWCANTMAKDD